MTVWSGFAACISGSSNTKHIVITFKNKTLLSSVANFLNPLSSQLKKLKEILPFSVKIPLNKGF